MAPGGIGMVSGDQIFNHPHHLRDILRCARHMVRLKIAQRRHIVQIPPYRLSGDLANAAAAVEGASVNFVIHISEISHIGDMAATISEAQQPVEHIKHDHIARIADMGAVVNRWSTKIQPDIGRIDRLKNLFMPGLRVVKFDLRHWVSLACGRAAGVSTSVQFGNKKAKPARLSQR